MVTAKKVPGLYTITLEGISPDDAAVLLCLLRSIGGKPSGLRGVADRLADALLAAGVQGPSYNIRVD